MRSQVQSTISDSSKFYYRGDEVKAVDAVMGCIFIHLDMMITKSTPSESIESDATIMELKDWAAAVRILKAVESNYTPTRGKLSIPTLSSSECKHALGIVATPILGRTVVCKPEHISNLAINCPNLIGCIEEIRVRAIRCPGIISASRMKRLASIAYPYITGEGAVNIVDSSAKVPGSGVVYDRVRQMKELQKKVYVCAVLRDGIKPVIASRTALDSTSST